MYIPESLQDLANSETVQFLKKPKTVGRIIAGVFALIIFSSLLTDGYQNQTDSKQLRCVLNSNGAACGFAVGAGVLALLCCLGFLLLDAREASMVSVRFKTAFQLLDFILAVLWTGIWFVGFCFLTNQWQHSTSHFLVGSSSAKAAIAFTFFSIFAWIFQAYLAFHDLRDDNPVPYKRTLDEGGMVLTTLSPPSPTSPINMPSAGPSGGLTYASSALSPYLTTPKGPRLAMMPETD